MARVHGDERPSNSGGRSCCQSAMRRQSEWSRLEILRRLLLLAASSLDARPPTERIAQARARTDRLSRSSADGGEQVRGRPGTHRSTVCAIEDGPPFYS